MKIIPHAFTSYELTAEEELQGQLLNQLQLAILQNLLCKVSTDKITLVFDTDKPDAYIQNEAYLRGQYDLIQHLLDLNNLALETIHSSNSQQ